MDSTKLALRTGLCRYREYRDSGVESLGEIPMHWLVKRLKFVSQVVAGQSPPSAAVSEGMDGVPFLQGNAEFGQVHPEACQSCDSAPKTARPGDILLSVRAPVGALNVADQVYGIGRGLCALRPVAGVDRSFYFYALMAIRPLLGAVGCGSTYDAVTRSDVGGLPMPIPPENEQRAIAEFLDRETANLDALVGRKERLIQLLQEKRAALIARAVTGGLTARVPIKDSGVEWLGEIPSHWDVKRMKFSARLYSGHTPSRQNPDYWKDCTIPWFGLADVWQIRDGQAEYVVDTSEKISEAGLVNSAATLLPKGTVILSRTASVGFSAILGVDMATTQDFVNWVCGQSLRPEYLLYVLRAMEQEFRRLTMGSTHQTIYMPDVGSFVAPVPPLVEQDQIVAYIRSEKADIEALIRDVVAAIGYVKEYRSAVVSTAVTGKIDVRQATIAQ
ncbi:MAG: restriction endonuclease subunit S [Chloroflexota bacterium]|nr:restriction endonuclease subunit S [Chloroflexota bacterium]